MPNRKPNKLALGSLLGYGTWMHPTETKQMAEDQWNDQSFQADRWTTAGGRAMELEVVPH